MLKQNDMFRANALGSFKDILMNVTQDPAMLVWLNGNQNVKQKPNENYGREMMELFTLGANRGAYTETDVREQARALTGWRGNVVNRQPNGFTFDPARHDTGTKTIYGRRGRYTWQDGVKLVTRHRRHPEFMVTKLWGYFIASKPSAFPLNMSTWSSSSRCEATPRFEVANQSCQTSVIRSIIGAFVRTIRSSHERWSCPNASAGASGRPRSSCGAGPSSWYGAGRVSAWTACLSPSFVSASASPARAPKPARHRSRSACCFPNGP
jgi:hypothetical protein